MSKKNLKWLIIFGVLCVLCVAAATGYSLNFNEGRLVYPMDFGSYHFQVKDIPPIKSVFLSCGADSSEEVPEAAASFFFSPSRKAMQGMRKTAPMINREALKVQGPT